MFKRIAALSTMLAGILMLSLPLCAQSAQGQLVPLAGRNNEDLSDPTARATFAISGDVQTTDGHPIADARVEVMNLTTGILVGSGYTGPRGSFVIQNLPRGAYEVTARSGLAEAAQQTRTDGFDVNITLRLPHTDSTSADSTISVEQMRVPDKAKQELQKARKSMAKKKPADVQKHLAKALEIYPQYSEALTVRALLALDRNDTESAIRDLDQAVQYDANNAMAYTALGAAYNSVQRFHDAIRETQHAIALDPKSWQAYFELAKGELGTGLVQDSLTHISRAEGLLEKPCPPIYLIKGYALLAAKEYSAAILEFEKYLGQETDLAFRSNAQQELERAKAFAALARK